MITPSQARGARALLGSSQQQIAEKAGVSVRTLMDFENDNRTPINATLAAIERALVEMGVEFIPENGGGAGVRLANRSGQGDSGGPG